MITAKMVKELRDRTGAGMLDCKKALEKTEGDIDKAVDYLREQGIATAAKKSGRVAADGLSAIKVDGNTAVILEVNSETDFVAKTDDFKALVEKLADVLLAEKPADMDAALALEMDGKSIADTITEATAKIGEKISFRRFEIIEKEDSQHFGTYTHMGGTVSAVVVLDGNEEIARDMAMQVASMGAVYVSRDDVPEETLNHEISIETEVVKNDPALSSKPEKILQGIVRGRVNKTLQEVSLVDQVYFKNPDEKVAKVLKDAGSEVVKFVRFAVGEGIEKREEDFAEEVAKAAQV